MARTVCTFLAAAALLGTAASMPCGGVMYCQAKHDMMTDGYLWCTSGGSYDSPDSQIIVQHFSPWRDGLVREISVGGGFGILRGADDMVLRPWFGYRAFVNTLDEDETYTLIVPCE